MPGCTVVISANKFAGICVKPVQFANISSNVPLVIPENSVSGIGSGIFGSVPKPEQPKNVASKTADVYPSNKVAGICFKLTQFLKVI